MKKFWKIIGLLCCIGEVIYGLSELFSGSTKHGFVATLLVTILFGYLAYRLTKSIKNTSQSTAAISATDWEAWDDSIHLAAGQADRIARACEQRLSIKKIKKDGTAVVRGSTGNIYCTRFDKCTCEDFKRRHLPCKHMYLYAIKHARFDPNSIFTMK